MFLLENGADSNQPLPDTGETPLHAALCKANSQAHELVIKVLLAHGARPNCATNPGVETGTGAMEGDAVVIAMGPWSLLAAHRKRSSAST